MEIEWILISKCIYMSYLHLFLTLIFRFLICNSIVNFYQKHYSRKKNPPQNRKITNTVVFRIETAAIFDRECHISCLLVIKGILGMIVFVYRKNKMAAESNIQMVKLKTMALPLHLCILPDLRKQTKRVAIRQATYKPHSKRRKSKRVNQRGNGIFSLDLPLLATTISTAVANS